MGRWAAEGPQMQWIVTSSVKENYEIASVALLLATFRKKPRRMSSIRIPSKKKRLLYNGHAAQSGGSPGIAFGGFTKVATTNAANVLSNYLIAVSVWLIGSLNLHANVVCLLL